MKRLSQNGHTRRQLLLLPLAAMGSYALTTTVFAKEPDSIKPDAEEGCPLNSGGPSLLDSNWKVKSVYANEIPQGVDIVMTINQESLTGSTSCNDYTADFKQVGYTGFRITKIEKGTIGCKHIRPVVGGPSINVGDIEGGYLRTLGRMGSVQRFDKDGIDTLVFYNRNGEQGIIMTRSA